jgi:hypothetical protein
MDNQIVISPFNGMLLSKEKEQTLDIFPKLKKNNSIEAS